MSDTDYTARVRAAASEYETWGWVPIPVPYKGKGAKRKGWGDLRNTPGHVARHFSGKRPMNIGVLLGEPSGGLVDVDLDCPEAVRLAPAFLPATGSVFGRPGNPRSHRLYRCTPPPETRPFRDVSGAADPMLVEVRSTGVQTVFPPSVHESGEPIAWEADGEPEEVAGEDLLRAVGVLAAACVLARHWPGEGSRQDAAMALAGGLGRAKWTEAECAHFVRSIAEAAGDEEAEKRADAVRHTFRTLAEVQHATGWPRLGDLIGNYVVGKVREYLRIIGSPPRGVGTLRRQHDAQDVQIFTIPKDTQRYTGLTVSPSSSPLSLPPGMTGEMTEKMIKVDQDFAHGGLSSLPLGDHIAACVEWHRHWDRHGRPAGEKWETPTWGLIRYLKGHPDLRDLTPGPALRAVEKVLTGWRGGGSAEAAWTHFTGHPGADVQGDFARGWDDVKYLPGACPLTVAFDAARVRPLTLPDEHYGGDQYGHFVSLAGWLQVDQGDRNILLPCNRMQERLGWASKTVSSHRKIAIKHGYLRVEKPSTDRDATEFRFDLSRFPELVAAACPRE